MTPPQAGVLRHLAHSPGNSQRELAEALGMHAPRLTALIDDLEGRGLVQRTRDPNDRRNYVLTLTAAGHQSLAQVATVARAHEHAITTALDDAERTQLAALLGRVAAEQGLAPGVHPGFRRMGR
jgi:DNA-binding MarR family transcriptional regulator